VIAKSGRFEEARKIGLFRLFSAPSLECRCNRAATVSDFLRWLDTLRTRELSSEGLPMKRRTVLRSLLSVPAAAALPSVTVPVAAHTQESRSGAPANRETPATPTTGADAAAEAILKTFNQAQFAALHKLGDILMPAAQDFPGASQAGAAEFLDFLIGASPADRVKLYRDGLDRLNAEAQRSYRKPFGEITGEQADPILAPLRAPWTYRGPTDPFAQFLQAAKDDLMTATVNSREYIAVVSGRRRSAGGVGQYWYPIE
jgi:hypothetical protein